MITERRYFQALQVIKAYQTQINSSLKIGNQCNSDTFAKVMAIKHKHDVASGDIILLASKETRNGPFADMIFEKVCVVGNHGPDEFYGTTDEKCVRWWRLADLYCVIGQQIDLDFESDANLQIPGGSND